MGWFKDYLVAYKLQYFLNFGAIGAASPFLHVLGRQLGFSQVSIGWVFGVAPFLDMLFKPVICSWADRRQLARPVFLVVLAVAGAALTSVILVPPLPDRGSDVNGTGITDNTSAITNNTGNTNHTAITDDTSVINHTADSSIMNSSSGFDLRQYQFWLYAVLVLLAWVGVGTNQTMADGMTAKMVESVGADFGRQRLWGTVGLSTMSTLSGYLIQLTSHGDHTDYSIGFYISGALMALNVLLCARFFKLPPAETKRSSWAEMAAALRHCRVFSFAVCCCALGVFTGLLWTFQFWYLDDLARAAGYPPSRVKLLEGLTLLVKGLGCQIPLMFMSGAILKRIGHSRAMTLAMLALGVYFIAYSQLVDPWYCLLVEPLAGAAYGLLYPAIASYACSIAPSGTAVTTQAIMTAAYDGLGVGSGTLLSAYIFSRYGGSVTYLSFGLAALAVAALYTAVSCLAERRSGTDGASEVAQTSSEGHSNYTPSEAVLVTEEQRPAMDDIL